MEFPHLSDTSFPDLANVNVYAYRNTFDYTRWVERTTVTLMNVLWNSEYDDVVAFGSDEARDSWFDSVEDVYRITLRTQHSIPPEGGIKLPIPFDVAARYNYMYVDVPIMTSAEDPIEYESGIGMRRWYFFVDTVSSRAPNTTMFNISLDVWTQFQNDVEIRYLFLERGHAPVAATDTDEYLSNPIANSKYLLTPDVTPSSATIVSDAEYIPFGNGEKYVCIASTCSPSQLSSLGTVTHDSGDYTYGNITYSDTSARNGYQLQVNGFGIGDGDDYSSLRAPSSPIDSSGRIANNVHVYAVKATDMYGSGTFMQDVLSTCPTFLRTVVGCFVVDSAMIVLGSKHSIASHDVWSVTGNETSMGVAALTRQMFGYPTRYQRFAKLYTHPYATIELTDNEGERVTVRIESTGTMTANLVTEIAFPFVSTRMYFTGIGGNGSSSYTWKQLDGTTRNMEMPDGEWFEHCFDHEIPCFALYMDPQTAWYLDNFNSSLRGGRASALASYHNSVRSANTSHENTIDMDATNNANQKATNDTNYDNTDADATTLTTNTTNSVNTITANTNATIATNSDKVSMANQDSSLVTLKSNQINTTTVNENNDATINTTITQNETTAATTSNTNNASINGALGSAILSSAVMGAAGGAAAGSVIPGAGTLAGAAGGMFLGALAGLANAALNADASSANASLVAQANSATASAVAGAQGNISSATNSAAIDKTTLLNNDKTYMVNADNTLLDANTARNNTCMTTNNGNTATTMRNNANRYRNTANANADAYKATSDANAGYTRETLVDNAKETLEASRNPAQFSMLDAGNSQARPVGSYAGDPTADYMMTRGVQVKVRTMPEAEVIQVGDWFARYGYALDQIWDVGKSGLVPMRHFCYWKCRDAWVDDRKSSNNAAVTLIDAMLRRGVTIWKDPDEVGRVSIYDN